MPFAHDWTIFYLAKDLRVTNDQILTALGASIVWESAYVHHLFNRLEQSLRNKFGHFLSCDKSEYESVLCCYKNVSGIRTDWKISEYFLSPCYWCLSIDLSVDTTFYIQSQEYSWIVEINKLKFVENEQAKQNLVKAINNFLA